MRAANPSKPSRCRPAQQPKPYPPPLGSHDRCNSPPHAISRFDAYRSIVEDGRKQGQGSRSSATEALDPTAGRASRRPPGLRARASVCGPRFLYRDVRLKGLTNELTNLSNVDYARRTSRIGVLGELARGNPCPPIARPSGEVGKSVTLKVPLRRLWRSVILVGGIALAPVLAGCTYGTSDAGPSGNTSSEAVAPGESSPVPSAAFSLPDALAAPVDVGKGEQKITELSSQTKGTSFGPLNLGGKTVVYLRCAGDGTLTFKLEGVGQFPLPCTKETEPHGTRNVFDTRQIPQATASVESSPGQIWAIGVYSEPIP